MQPTPKIVVLDGHTLSPLGIHEESADHPSWSHLASLGDFHVHPRTAASDVPEVAADADVVLTNKVPLNAATFNALPHLRYVGVMATGTNIVDLGAAARAGITVTNVPGYSTPSVAQIVAALLLELVCRTGETVQAVRSGAWAESPDFSFTLGPWRELAGRTFGILGLGAIGSVVAGVARALGMSVVFHTRTPRQGTEGCQWVSFEDLIKLSDVLSLHCPLTPETQGCLGSETLKLMKPSALVINTARGGLVDEAAVAAALHAGELGGYGADVLSKEPPPANHPLIAAPRTAITPHLAWASIEARHRLMQTLVSNLKGFLDGTPVNVV